MNENSQPHKIDDQKSSRYVWVIQLLYYKSTQLVVLYILKDKDLLGLDKWHTLNIRYEETLIAM